MKLQQLGRIQTRRVCRIWEILVTLFILLGGVEVFALESPENEYHVFSFRWSQIQIPVEFTVKHIENASGRLVVTVSKRKILENKMWQVDSEIWYFQNYPRRTDLIQFSDRKTVLQLSSIGGGERSQAAARTVSILDATAVEIRLHEGSTTKLFDTNGKPIPVEWPKIQENGRLVKPGFVIPLAWKTSFGLGERSHKLICQLYNLGGTRVFFASFELETGNVDLVSSEDLTTEFLVSTITHMLRH